MATEAAAPQRSKLKSILLYGFLTLVALVGVLCVVIAMQPEDFKVARSATFNASPAAVFEQVNDLHKWDAWSPWAKLDPNAKSSFEGPTSGKDAKMSWDGNADVGAGSMTIVDSKPNELVRLRLDFVRPFEGTSDVEMKVEPVGDQAKLTWSMSGKNNFIAKAISMVIDCEKMCGDQFEQGLSNLKGVVESQPAGSESKPSDT